MVVKLPLPLFGVDLPNKAIQFSYKSCTSVHKTMKYATFRYDTAEVKNGLNETKSA